MNGTPRPSPLPACGERVRPAAEQAERSEAGVRGGAGRGALRRRCASSGDAPSPSPAAQACCLRKPGVPGLRTRERTSGRPEVRQPSPRKRGEAKLRLPAGRDKRNSRAAREAVLIPTVCSQKINLFAARTRNAGSGPASAIPQRDDWSLPHNEPFRHPRCTDFSPTSGDNSSLPRAGISPEHPTIAGPPAKAESVPRAGISPEHPTDTDAQLSFAKRALKRAMNRARALKRALK